MLSQEIPIPGGGLPGLSYSSPLAQLVLWSSSRMPEYHGPPSTWHAYCLIRRQSSCRSCSFSFSFGSRSTSRLRSSVSVSIASAISSRIPVDFPPDAFNFYQDSVIYSGRDLKTLHNRVRQSLFWIKRRRNCSVSITAALERYSAATICAPNISSPSYVKTTFRPGNFETIFLSQYTVFSVA